MSISHKYMLPIAPKQMVEAVSLAQQALHANTNHWRYSATSNALQEILNACERMRPTGSDGKHGDRHTPQCGCMDNPLGRYCCRVCSGKGFIAGTREFCTNCKGSGWTDR